LALSPSKFTLFDTRIDTASVGRRIRQGTDINRSLEQSVRDDLKIVRDSPMVRQELKDKAIGFVFDIKTGLLTKVE